MVVASLPLWWHGGTIGKESDLPVATPGFVARRGKDGNYVMGHSRWTSGPGAAAA